MRNTRGRALQAAPRACELNPVAAARVAKRSLELHDALIAVIGDEDTVTGMLLAGVGNVDARKASNFMVVDSSARRAPAAAKGEGWSSAAAPTLLGQLESPKRTGRLTPGRAPPPLGTSSLTLHPSSRALQRRRSVRLRRLSRVLPRATTSPCC